MKLENKYVVGCHVMWYEVEMFPEYIDSCMQIMKDIENPENVTFDICFNFQEYLEEVSGGHGSFYNIGLKFETQIDRLLGYGVIVVDRKYGPNEDTKSDEFYNIAAYRRDLNYNYCDKVDFVLWGETDSLWPRQTFEIIETVSNASEYPKFVLNFAGRKNWDKSWDIITHPLFEIEQFIDTDDWVLENEASEKSYMSLNRMNEINSFNEDNIQIQLLTEPKADGSCLVISSDLIKSGVNIPHALIHCGEDESFMRMAKLVMGDQFVQYNVKNILRVHNRRHPKKRTYIKGENNPKGFCTVEKKGLWWEILEKTSKSNLDNLRKQIKFIKLNDVMEEIMNVNEKLSKSE